LIAVYEDGFAKMYIDGELRVSTQKSADTGASTLCIGTGVESFIGGNTSFPGIIDEVRIYSRALSSNEVAQLYVIESAPPFTITQDLTNNSAVYGQNATFTFHATNASSPVSYQWYWQPSNNVGQQAGAYAQTIVGFVYGVVVTNGGFGYGNIPAVSFVGGGGSGAGGYATVSNGVVTSVTVTNAGSGYSTLPAVVIGPPNGLLYGETNGSYTILNASSNSLGTYFCIATSGGNSLTSSVVNLTLLYPPTIAVNPSGYIGDYRSTNILSVTAAGTPPFSYQWQLNGTNILGATNSSLVVANLTLTNSGPYSVIVSSPYGSVTSSVANVYLTPTLTAPFTGAVALWGQDTTIAVGAVGSGVLGYQWFYNGTAIPDATSSTLTIPSIQFTNAGLYGVVVSTAHGSVTNTAYQVVVNPAETATGTCPIIYITGTTGYSYMIQSTTDLSDTNAWMSVTNVILPYTPFIWADTATDTSKASNPRRYYRVIPGQ
jgi:hypothetical protein